LLINAFAARNPVDEYGVMIKTFSKNCLCDNALDSGGRGWEIGDSPFKISRQHRQSATKEKKTWLNRNFFVQTPRREFGILDLQNSCNLRTRKELLG
jgi:hypothetical protein